MTTAIKQERNISLDAIKILSCIMVVLLHSLRAFDKTVELHTYLYYFCRCTMPLFFMAAGAVQLLKDKIDYKYCFKKNQKHNIAYASILWMRHANKTVNLS